jgi:hypothetical protein
MPASPAERRLAAQVAAHASWAMTPDRSARTANARAALMQRFLDEADGDVAKAESLRRAHFARLSLASARARRRRAGIGEEDSAVSS